MRKSNSRSKSSDTFTFGTTHKTISLPKYLKMRVSFVKNRKHNWLCQLQMLPILSSSGMWNVVCHLAGSITYQFR